MKSIRRIGVIGWIDEVGVQILCYHKIYVAVIKDMFAVEWQSDCYKYDDQDEFNYRLPVPTDRLHTLTVIGHEVNCETR